MAIWNRPITTAIDCDSTDLSCFIPAFSAKGGSLKTSTCPKGLDGAYRDRESLRGGRFDVAEQIMLPWQMSTPLNPPFGWSVGSLSKPEAMMVYRKSYQFPQDSQYATELSICLKLKH